MYGEINSLKANQLRDIPDEVIYNFYLEYYPKIGKKYKSPINKKDKDPSFTFFMSKGRLKFKCFSSGHGGDCIHLIAVLEGLDYEEAKNKVISDLIGNGGLSKSKIQGSNVPLDEVYRANRASKSSSEIKVVLRDIVWNDILYWKKVGLTKEDLEFYNIKPCEEVWLNNRIWYLNEKDNPCYRYVIGDKYKVYCPLTKNKTKKWLSNSTFKHVQGYNLLPDSGDLLVITKSYKDVVVLNKHLKVNAIAFSSESNKISETTVKYLYSKFKRIIIFFDNDEPGIRYATERSEETGIPFKNIPNKYNSKDASELYEYHGKEVFTSVLKQMLNI